MNTLANVRRLHVTIGILMNMLGSTRALTIRVKGSASKRRGIALVVVLFNLKALWLTSYKFTK